MIFFKLVNNLQVEAIADLNTKLQQVISGKASFRARGKVDG